MIFTLGTTVVELEAPAQYPHTPSTKLIQAKDQSASGIVHVESFEVQTGTDTYNFKNMSQSDYVALLSFFINIAEGMLHEFELTDDLGSTKTSRFTSPELSFTKTDFQLWDGSFTVERQQ